MTSFLQAPALWAAALLVVILAALGARLLPGSRERRRRLLGLVARLQSADARIRVEALERAHSQRSRDRALLARMLRARLSGPRGRRTSGPRQQVMASWLVRQILALLEDPRADVRTDAARVLRALLARDGSQLARDRDPFADLVPPVAAAVELVGGRVLLDSSRGRDETRVLAFAEMLEAGLRPLAASLQGAQGAGEEAAALATALRDRSLRVRRSLCDVLAGMGGDRSVEMLAELLRDPSPELRAQAAEALGRLKAEEASSRVAQLLRDPAPAVRAAAASSLAEIGLEETCGPVIEALSEECRREDGVQRTRSAMVNAIVRLSNGGQAELAKALGDLPRPVASRLASSLETEGVVERWLADSGQADREQLLSTLLAAAARLGVTGALLEGLDSTEDSVRLRCAAALSNSHDPGAIPSLAGLLNDPGSQVRAEAVKSIAKLGGPDALAPLCLAVGDPDSAVRLGAATGFSEILSHRSRWNTDALPADFDLQAGLSEARKALLTAAADSEPAVRADAARALSFLGSAEAAEKLADLALTDPANAVREASVEALARCGFAQSRRFLAAALEDENETRRERAMSVLGGLGGPEAGRHVVEALGDPSPRVRAAAVAALPGVAVTAVADQLVSHLRSSDPQVRAAAASGLAGSQEAECVDALVQALSDPEEQVRINALGALAGMGRAVRRHERALRARQSDPGLRVREAASAALQRLGAAWAQTAEAHDLPGGGPLSAAETADLVDTAIGGDPDPLLQALGDGQSARSIAAFLAESGGPPLAAVLSSLRRAHAADRDRATAALGQALREGVPLAPYLAELKAVDSDVRLMAIEIAGRLGAPNAVQGLLEVLEHDPLSEARSRAASALAESDDGAVKAALRRARRQDPDRIVRRTAARALEGAGGAARDIEVLSAPPEATSELDSAQAGS